MNMARLRAPKAAWASLIRAGLALTLLLAGTPRTFAAQVSASVPAAVKPLYAPVTADWARALGGLALPPSLGLGQDDLAREDRRQILAPMIFQLTEALGLDAAGFAAISEPAEKQAALALAAEEAAGALETQGYALTAQAKALAWSKNHPRREKLKRLPELLAWLAEMRGYGAYLSQDLQDLIAQETARQLTGGGSAEDSPQEKPALAAREPALRRHGSGEKLLDRMKQTKAGWGQRQIHRLLQSFGFSLVQSGHRRYQHHRFASLRTTIPRQNELPVGYIKDLLNLMENLKLLEAQTPGAGLPALRTTELLERGENSSRKSRRLAPPQALAERQLAPLSPPAAPAAAVEAQKPSAASAAATPAAALPATPQAPGPSLASAPEARVGGWRGFLRSAWAALRRRLGGSSG